MLVTFATLTGIVIIEFGGAFADSIDNVDVLSRETVFFAVF